LFDGAGAAGRAVGRGSEGAVLPSARAIASVKNIRRTGKIFGDLDQIDVPGRIKEPLIMIRGSRLGFDVLIRPIHQVGIARPGRSVPILRHIVNRNPST